LELRWTTLEVVLGVGVVRRWLYLAAKPSHKGVDIDELSCPLHRPIACGCQSRVQSSWSGTVLLYLVAKLFLRESVPQRGHMLLLTAWGLEPMDWHHLV
jgi:hypothetical protein